MKGREIDIGAPSVFDSSVRSIEIRVMVLLCPAAAYLSPFIASCLLQVDIESIRELSQQWARVNTVADLSSLASMVLE